MSRFTEYATNSDEVVGYFCDVEGNLDYWERYLNISKVLERVPISLGSVTAYQSHRGSITLKDNCHFVYGGDVCDRGKGDIRILSDLVNLKESYPDRVHLLLGNRDMNKMRLPFMLHPTILKDVSPWGFWVPKDPGVSACSTATERLQWGLAKTMGSPISFESRREELIELGLSSEDEDVTDSYLQLVKPDGLLTKYIEQAKICVILGDMIFIHGALHENNFEWVPPMAETITPGCDHATALDRINDGKLGWLCKGNIRQWAEAVNIWKDSEIADYKKNYPVYSEVFVHGASDVWDYEGGYEHPQPGSRLLQYGMGSLPGEKPAPTNPTVIYSSYLNMGKIMELECNVAEALIKNGITKVVVGHQPQADAALILDNYGVQVISFDNSYSGFVQWPVEQLEKKDQWTGGDLPATEEKDAWKSYADYCKANSITPIASNEKAFETRSLLAMAGMYFELSRSQEGAKASTTSKVTIQGALSAALTYAFELKPASKYIGKKAKNGWYVKASGVEWDKSETVTTESLHSVMTGRLPDVEGSYYLLSKSEGFSFWNRLVREGDINLEME